MGVSVSFVCKALGMLFPPVLHENADMSWLPALRKLCCKSGGYRQCSYFEELQRHRVSLSIVPKDYIVSIVGPYSTRSHFTGEPLLSVVLTTVNVKRLKEDITL